MVKDRRALAAVVTGAALVLGLAWARQPAQALDPPLPRATVRTAAAGVAEVPVIDLARIETRVPGSDVGAGRDLFEFESAPALQPTTSIAPPPPVELPEAPERAGPTQPALPSLNVKYIGAVQDKRGLKVAVLITEHREILTGQAGEVVGNRLRIVRIGLESVDVQDVGGGAVRRIPLRGN